MQSLHRYSGPEILRFIPALIIPSSVKLGDSLEDTVTTVHPRATPRDHSFHLPFQDIVPHLNATLCVTLSIHQIQACRINPSGRFSTSIYLSGNWIVVCFSFFQSDFLHAPTHACASVYMYSHVCTHARASVHVYVHTHIRACASMYVYNRCVHTHVQVCLCIFTCVHVPVQVCMSIVTCAHMSVQVCMCLYTHSHTFA